MRFVDGFKIPLPHLFSKDKDDKQLHIIEWNQWFSFKLLQY